MHAVVMGSLLGLVLVLPLLILSMLLEYYKREFVRETRMAAALEASQATDVTDVANADVANTDVAKWDVANASESGAVHHGNGDAAATADRNQGGDKKRVGGSCAAAGQGHGLQGSAVEAEEAVLGLVRCAGASASESSTSEGPASEASASEASMSGPSGRRFGLRIRKRLTASKNEPQ
jgi:hypothetical protein